MAGGGSGSTTAVMGDGSVVAEVAATAMRWELGAVLVAAATACWQRGSLSVVAAAVVVAA